MNSLKETFRKASLWHNNRASTFFPVFTSSGKETYLVFQNYWKWKNDNPNCVLNLRFYSKSGNLLKIYSENISKYHNEINLTKTIKEEKALELSNNYCTVEAEIISLKNIGYPFPALVIFHRCLLTNEVTCVHSAGRVENSNEQKSSKDYEETNWLTKNDKDFSPFFHFFNTGHFYNTNKRKAKAEILIAGNPKLNFIINFSLPEKPFSSKIFYIKDYLSNEQASIISDNEFFVNLRFASFGVMRLIVGNYHFKKDFHYTTHSYGKIKSKDDIIEESKDKISSFLPLLNIKPLQLRARSYPTNIQKKLKLEINDFPPHENNGKHKGDLFINTAGKKNEINTFELNQQMMSLYLIKGSVPSRLNTSYNYYLTNSTHPTDIATGFVTIQQPQKYNHWGHGFLLKGFNTVIMIRNFHPRIDLKEISDKLILNIEFSSLNSNFTRSLKILPNSWNFLKISYEDFNEKEGFFFSWKFKDPSESGSMEAIWLSYSNESGSICGDHSF